MLDGLVRLDRRDDWIEKESTFLSSVAKLGQDLLFRTMVEDITNLSHIFLLFRHRLTQILGAFPMKIIQVEKTVISLFNMKPKTAISCKALLIRDL
jgi:hypothetical protein